MKYINAVKYIESLQKEGSSSLKQTRQLLSLLGNPQHAYRCVHVAGTNGKGSSCAFLHSILRSAGYHAGMYTSPYLQRFEERMQTDAPISQQDLCTLVQEIKDVAKSGGIEGLGYFGFTTALAFLWFARQGVDIAVIETGVGGRLDPTNVINPACCLITSISKDHSHILGDDLGKIAYEKCGIIKDGAMVISHKQPSLAMETIDNICKERMSGLISLNNVRVSSKVAQNGEIFRISFTNWQLKDIFVPLRGKHQVQNAAGAVLVAKTLSKEGLDIPDSAIIEGIGKTVWPGRMEELSYKGVKVLLDGAHNPGAAKILSEGIKRFYPDENITLLMALMQDKEIGRITAQFKKFVQSVVLTVADAKRGVDTASIAKRFKGIGVTEESNVKKALDKAVRLAGKNGMVVVAGSIYLVGQVRDIILK